MVVVAVSKHDREVRLELTVNADSVGDRECWPQCARSDRSAFLLCEVSQIYRQGSAMGFRWGLVTPVVLGVALSSRVEGFLTVPGAGRGAYHKPIAIAQEEREWSGRSWACEAHAIA